MPWPPALINSGMRNSNLCNEPHLFLFEVQLGGKMNVQVVIGVVFSLAVAVAVDFIKVDTSSRQFIDTSGATQQ